MCLFSFLTLVEGKTAEDSVTVGLFKKGIKCILMEQGKITHFRK